MENVLGLDAAKISVAERVKEVVGQHKKAQEAISKLRTTKEVKEEELNSLLKKYSDTYGETVKIEQVPDKLQELKTKISEKEAKILKACDEFKEKWEGGDSNEN